MSATPVSLRVLVVDDHDECRELLAELISDSGCTVRVARTGTEAVAVSGEFMPEVVLLDLGLPDMNGYAVAMAIRSNPVTADAFIAAVTGHGTSSDRTQAASAGIDMFLVKPVGWADLRAALNGVRTTTSAGATQPPDPVLR